MARKLPQSPPGDGQRPLVHKRRSSLYVRVVVVNAVILLSGLLLLLWTPITVSAPVSTRQAIVLVAGLVVMTVVDAALLKVSFTGLVALVHRMQTLDVLQPRERLPEMGGAETRALISGFNAMLDRVEAERLSSTRRNVTTLEGERARISRELHDEIGQRMTGMLLQLGPIHDEASGTVRLGVARVRDEARAVLEEIGRLAWQMRPGMLDDLGLLSALEALTGSLGGNGPTRIELVLPHQQPSITSEAELAVYRIAQESLTNAVRHSSATTITVEMQVTESELMLWITDDGHGTHDADREGPGVRGMRERALLIGGRLSIQENPPHGLRVELAIPTGNLGG